MLILKLHKLVQVSIVSKSLPLQLLFASFLGKVGHFLERFVEVAHNDLIQLILFVCFSVFLGLECTYNTSVRLFVLFKGNLSIILLLRKTKLLESLI